MKSETDGDVSSRPRMELKYCERCGGLWVRDYGSTRVYCRGCRPLIAQLPAEMKRRKPRLPLAPEELESNDHEVEFWEEDALDANTAGGVA